MTNTLTDSWPSIPMGEEPSKRCQSWAVILWATENVLITSGKSTAHPAIHFCLNSAQPNWNHCTHCCHLNRALNSKGSPLRENDFSSKLSFAIKATSWVRNNTNTIIYSGKSFFLLSSTPSEEANQLFKADFALGTCIRLWVFQQQQAIKSKAGLNNYYWDKRVVLENVVIKQIRKQKSKAKIQCKNSSISLVGKYWSLLQDAMQGANREVWNTNLTHQDIGPSVMVNCIEQGPFLPQSVNGDGLAEAKAGVTS